MPKKHLFFPGALVFRAVILLALTTTSLAGILEEHSPDVKQVDVGAGIVLHYVEKGHGVPMVFVHGSLSDFSYWTPEVEYFSKYYRAIAYSRRYNYPNQNPARPGYSAVTDADDLAALIRKLSLRRAIIVGHSYGAYAALFFASKYPQLVGAMVLAEAPAVPLLKHVPGQESEPARAMLDDIEMRMVKPMQEEFRRGERDAGVGTFIDYVFNDPRVWEKMSTAERADTMRDAHEWDVMMTNGTLFPEIRPSDVANIKVPVLLLLGAKTYPFLKVITNEVARLLPHTETLVAPNAGHQMWYQDPKLCRNAVEKFLSLQDWGRPVARVKAEKQIVRRIIPFEVPLYERECDDLRRRLEHALFPGNAVKPAWELGTDLHFVRKTCRDWRDEFERAKQPIAMSVEGQ